MNFPMLSISRNLFVSHVIKLFKLLEQLWERPLKSFEGDGDLGVK